MEDQGMPSMHIPAEKTNRLLTNPNQDPVGTENILVTANSPRVVDPPKENPATVTTTEPSTNPGDDYDDYQVPANLTYAEIHGNATLAGNYSSIFDLEDNDIRTILPEIDQVKGYSRETCPCCQRIHIIDAKAPLTTRTKFMGKLGTAIPGFFEYTKFTIYNFIVAGLVYSIYTAIKYGTGQVCSYSEDTNASICGQRWKFYLSSRNSPEKVDYIERLLFIGSWLIIYALKVIFYRNLRKLESENDSALTDITDYTVEVRGLPQDICKKDIIDFFAKQELKDDDGKVVPIKVKLINFVYSDIETIKNKQADLEVFVNKYLKETNSKAIKAKRQTEGENFDEKQYIQGFDTKMNVLEEEAKQLLREKYFVHDSERRTVPNFSGGAYVSFETMLQSELVTKQMAVSSVGKIFYKLFGSLRGPFARVRGAYRHQLSPEGGYFYIEKAEVPGEILFENLGYTPGERFKRNTIANVLTILFLAITFILIFLLKGAEFNLNPDASSTKVLSVVITVVIKIAGFILGFTSEALVNYSKPETTTQKKIAIIWRSAVSVFFNSTILLVLANLYFQKDKLEANLYQDVGLMNDLWFLLILSILEAGLSFLEPSLILNAINRSKVRKEGNDSTVVQKDANAFYEGAVFDYSRRFLKFLNLMMLTFFIVRIMPLAPAYAIAICIAFYWSDKFFLLRLAKIPEICTVELPLSMLRFVDMIFVVWSLGYVIFDKIILQEVAVWSWAMFGISCFNLLINPNYILRKIFKYSNDEGNQAQKTLKEFLNGPNPLTYAFVNPVNLLDYRLYQYGKDGFLAEMRLGPPGKKDIGRDNDKNAILNKLVEENVEVKISEAIPENLPVSENNQAGSIEPQEEANAQVDDDDTPNNKLAERKGIAPVAGNPEQQPEQQQAGGFNEPHKDHQGERVEDINIKVGEAI